MVLLGDPTPKHPTRWRFWNLRWHDEMWQPRTSFQPSLAIGVVPMSPSRQTWPVFNPIKKKMELCKRPEHDGRFASIASIASTLQQRHHAYLCSRSRLRPRAGVSQWSWEVCDHSPCKRTSLAAEYSSVHPAHICRDTLIRDDYKHVLSSAWNRCIESQLRGQRSEGIRRLMDFEFFF